MSSPPLVSVLVRSMDRPTLARALESVAVQSHAKIEVIVVAACGARHRDLPETCGAFPLRLVRSAMPLARAAAANAALDAARGSWLNLLDDDDALLPDHIGALLRAIDQQPGARLAHARSSSVDAAGHRVDFGAKFRPWRQLDTGFFHSQAALFAHSLVSDGVRFDTRFDILEDMDFFVQCAQRTPFAFLDRVTSVSYRDAGNSGTGTQRDHARVGAAIAQLRAKWSALERSLHASAEFRLEKTLWLIGQRDLRNAEAELRGIARERADWPDAIAARALLAASAGDAAAARGALAELGERQPDEPALRAQLLQLREWLQAT